MAVLTAVLAILVAIAILFEMARRLGVPYPSLFVLGGLRLGFIPGLARIRLEPDLVLLVFLPPLLFTAAVATPIREPRANLAPLARLSIGLVLFSAMVVAFVAQVAIPTLGWPAVFALGAIVAPTDAVAATAVFRSPERRGLQSHDGVSCTLVSQATMRSTMRSAVWPASAWRPGSEA